MLPTLAVLTAVILLPAHASVIGSTPGAGDVVTEQPGAFSVVMNEELLSVEGASGSNAIQVTDAAGLFYGDGCVTVDGDTASMQAQLGEAGDYAMTFQVVSADGHPVSDTIDFTFDPTEGQAGEPGVTEAPVCGVAAPEAASSAAPATASAEQGSGQGSDQGDAGDAGAPAAQGDSFPFIAIGVIALLALLALIAYRANRLRGQVRGGRDAEPTDAEPTDDEV
jgi:copper resistance protein C